MLRNLMLVANASSAVVGFAVLGLAAALHFGERPEGHLDIGLVHADDALFALGGAVVGVSLLGLLGSREVRAQGRCAAGLLSAYAICLLLLLLALGGLGVHAYTSGASVLSAELDSHWGAVQAVVQEDIGVTASKDAFVAALHYHGLLLAIAGGLLALGRA